MRSADSIAVLGWSVEPSGGDGRPLAVVRGSEGWELRLEVSFEEARWLMRSRHPAYSRHLRSMLDVLAQRASWLELNASPSGPPTATIVASAAGTLHRKEIPLGLALLLCHMTELELYVDEALPMEANAAHHLEQEVRAFARFLENVSAEDFAGSE